MKLEIQHQESLSRGQLLLRTFFGIFYIVLPHAFVLIFMMIASGFIKMISFWAILFTGRYPESMFNFQVNLLKWQMRLNASLYNLTDEYPAFGLSTEAEYLTLEVEYPESLSRGKLLLKMFFGIFYVMIPHVFVLYFRIIATMFLKTLGWWVILFTGRMPESWHEFIVGTFRWSTRLNLYLGNMSDVYPPFTGKPV